MKEILGHLRAYIKDLNKTVLVLTTIFIGVLVFLNYHFGLDNEIAFNYSLTDQLVFRIITFLLAFGMPYVFYNLVQKKKYFTDVLFVLLFFAGPVIFALKMVIDPTVQFSTHLEENRYWNQVFYWPVLCIMTLTALALIWRATDREQSFYGLTTKNLKFQPYLLMLLIMLPLVAAASTQPDFLAVYPKLKALNFGLGSMEINWWHKLLFEISYGTDFITIEVFFRGFLVLAFIKWAGKDAILPMACFYCTIHFGKPLGECISSYFGGILLGVVVFHTRSVLGGLMVHLGIAWMMEAGGFIGNEIFK